MASVRILIQDSELFCRGMARRNAALTLMTEEVLCMPPAKKARSWRILERLFRNLPDHLPTVVSSRAGQSVTTLAATAEAQLKEPALRALHERWQSLWADEEDREIRAFMLRSVVVLIDNYRLTWLRQARSA